MLPAVHPSANLPQGTVTSTTCYEFIPLFIYPPIHPFIHLRDVYWAAFSGTVLDSGLSLCIQKKIGDWPRKRWWAGLHRCHPMPIKRDLSWPPGEPGDGRSGGLPEDRGHISQQCTSVRPVSGPMHPSPLLRPLDLTMMLAQKGSFFSFYAQRYSPKLTSRNFKVVHVIITKLKCFPFH